MIVQDTKVQEIESENSRDVHFKDSNDQVALGFTATVLAGILVAVVAKGVIEGVKFAWDYYRNPQRLTNSMSQEALKKAEKLSNAITNKAHAAINNPKDRDKYNKEAGDLYLQLAKVIEDDKASILYNAPELESSIDLLLESIRTIGNELKSGKRKYIPAPRDLSKPIETASSNINYSETYNSVLDAISPNDVPDFAAVDAQIANLLSDSGFTSDEIREILKNSPVAYVAEQNQSLEGYWAALDLSQENQVRNTSQVAEQLAV